MNKIKLKHIIIAMEIFLVFILSLFLYINYKTIENTLLSMETKKIKKIIQSNLPTISTLYRLGFHKDLHEIITALEKNNPNIKKIYISAKKEPEKLSFTLNDKDKPLGYLVVDYDYVTTHKFLDKYKNRVFGLTLFFFILILSSIYFLNKKLNAVYLLSERIKNINLQNIQKIPFFNNYEEIHNITTSINYFIETIKKNLKHFHTIQRHLKEAQKIAKLSSWEYNPSNQFFYATTQLYRILQLHTGQRLHWKQFLNFFVPKDREQFLQELRTLQERKDLKSVEVISKLYTPNGEKYLKNIIKKQIRHNELRFIAISMDITEEMKAKSQVEFMAYHDALTGFFNRHALSNQIELIENLAQREKKKFALFYIDIDNFKFINDTYGHGVGDQILISFAKRIEHLIRKSDLIFRIGGDEFLILFYDVKEKRYLKEIAKKIIHIAQKPLQIDNHSFQIQCSIGISLYPDDSENTTELIQFADVAMYEAKRTGKNSYKIFDQKMKNSRAISQDILDDLESALQRENELQLYIQPKINLVTKEICGGEILLRWFHPKKGLISPGEFIPLAEETNLILKLDRYVLKKSFQKILQWQKDGINDMKIAINLSAKQFKDPLISDTMQLILDLYPIDTFMVELEVTESVSMEEIGRSIDILKYLKSLGFSIGIDDFGTGYSSLNYIKKLPFDTLKIDRSFIQDIHKDKDDRAITELIIKIAKTLQKEVVAEGVENEIHEELLCTLSCDYAQGFYYFKPMPLEEFEKLLHSLKQ